MYELYFIFVMQFKYAKSYLRKVTDMENGFQVLNENISYFYQFCTSWIMSQTIVLFNFRKKLAKKLAKAERMTDFSDDLKSTDSENEPDLNLMTEAERKEYLEKKAKRKAEREEKRKERYGDKYDKMVEKHKQ